MTSAQQLDDDNELTVDLLLVDEAVLDGGSALDFGSTLLLLRDLDVVDEEEA